MAKAAPFIPAALGAVSSIFGGGQGKGPSDTQTTQLSPEQQRLQSEQLAAGRQFVNQPFQQFQGPRTAQFGQEFQQGVDRLTQLDPGISGQFRGAGSGLGIGSDFFQNFLGGQGPGGPQFNAETLAQFQNPFTQGVIDPVRAEFDWLRGQARQDVGDEAIFGGFQGGSRAAIERGARLGELDRSQAQVIGQLQQRGFEDAAGRLRGEQGRFDQFTGQQLGAAGQAANLGFGSLGQLQNMIQQAGAAGLNSGQIRQALEQFGIGQEREKFGEQRAFDLQNLGVQQSLLGGLPPQGTVTGQQTPAPDDPFQSIGGQFITGLSSFLGNQFQNPAPGLGQQISQQQPLTPPVQPLPPSQFPVLR